MHTAEWHLGSSTDYGWHGFGEPTGENGSYDHVVPSVSNALCHLSCNVAQIITVSDHALVIGSVTDIASPHVGRDRVRSSTTIGPFTNWGIASSRLRHDERGTTASTAKRSNARSPHRPPAMIVRELGAHPATATAAGVARGDFTALEVTDATLNALGAVAHLNAVITVCAEEARHQAATAVGGPLAGVSVLVKDLFDTAGIKTTYGSAVFADHVPATNATAVDRVKASGGIIVGRPTCMSLHGG